MSDMEGKQRLAQAVFKVDSTHHFGFGDDGLTCLCGFVGNARKRTQTEHITSAIVKEFNHE